MIIPPVSLPAGLVANPSQPDFIISPSSHYFEAPEDNFHNAYAAMSLAADPWLSGQPLKPCAYNFTLTVDDRVTNGTGRIHWTYHMMTLTVLA